MHVLHLFSIFYPRLKKFRWYVVPFFLKKKNTVLKPCSIRCVVSAVPHVFQECHMHVSWNSHLMNTQATPFARCPSHSSTSATRADPVGTGIVAHELKVKTRCTTEETNKLLQDLGTILFSRDRTSFKDM